jgi:hypothetical protein
MVTPEQLQEARAAVLATQAPYKAAIKERRRLVSQAIREGMRPAHAAKAAGVSRTTAGRLR